MRLGWLSAIAVIILTGCARPSEPPLVDAPILAAAYESFRAGNDTAIGQAYEVVAARLPADPAVLTQCDAQGYAARRLVRLKDKLDFLDSSTAASFGENARFLYLEGLLFGREGHKRRTPSDTWPTDFDCRKDPAYDHSRRIDDRESQAVREEARQFLGGWRRDLHKELGPEYRARMLAAAELLHTNHLRAHSHWEENGNYD